MNKDNEYKRKTKENKPVIAICYDFDKTLSPNDMQAQGYIQSIGYDVNDFWMKSNRLAEENEMDQNLAYMYMMVKGAHGKIIVNRDSLMDYGSKVTLFPGVEEWFERINKYGKEKGVIVEHYIISSGLKEMIEGTNIAQNGVFEKIYACSFYYDDDGVAIWPAQVVNFTNKTQFLFRIEKGALDVNDSAVNDYFDANEIRVPFRNMVYIGDSDTDIPCMKLVNTYGGYSIGVYNSDTEDKTKVYRMMKEQRIRYFVPADYSCDSELDLLLKTIIDRTVENERLESIHYDNTTEVESYIRETSPTEIDKEDGIDALNNCASFASTHYRISILSKYDNWTKSQIEKLFRVALNNSQVRLIIKDTDIKEFYNKLIDNYDGRNEDMEEVKSLLK